MLVYTNVGKPNLLISFTGLHDSDFDSDHDRIICSAFTGLHDRDFEGLKYKMNLEGERFTYWCKTQIGI